MHALPRTGALGLTLVLLACSGEDSSSPSISVLAGGAPQSAAQGGMSGISGQSSQAGAGAGAGAGAAGSSSPAGGAGQGGAGGEQGGAGTSSEAGAGGASGDAGQGGISGISGQAGDGGSAGEDPGLPVCECFVKVGWCGLGVAEEAAKKGCSVPLLPENEGDLLYCLNGEWAVKQECAYGCDQQPTGTPDTCKPKPQPDCPCFVQSSWCGTGAAKEAEKMGCTIPLLPTHAGDLLYCPNGKWSVKQECTFGCNEAPTGTPDTCKSDPNALCTLLSPPHKAQIKWGLHPDASDALAAIGVTAAGISQTIGSAAASAGTHAQDGTSGGFAYSAATDLRTVGKTEAQIHTFLDNLAKAGFVAWYRKPGSDGWPSSEAPHIHAIWVGAKMKLSLRNQVRDFMDGKNGLASHTKYKFHTWSQCWRDALWKRYLKYNPASG